MAITEYSWELDLCLNLSDTVSVHDKPRATDKTTMNQLQLVFLSTLDSINISQIEGELGYGAVIGRGDI